MEDKMTAIDLVKETICDKEVPTEVLISLLPTIIKLLDDIRRDAEVIRLSMSKNRCVEDLIAKTLQYITMIETGNLFVSILETIGDELKERQRPKTSSSFS